MTSLAATYIDTVILRRMLEAIFEHNIEKIEDCVETNADALDKESMNKLFDSLIPANQARVRIFNRYLCRMTYETFEMTNVEKKSRVVEAAEAEEETNAAESHASLDVDDDLHDEVERVQGPSPRVRCDVGKGNPEKSPRGRQSHGLEREYYMLDEPTKYESDDYSDNSGLGEDGADAADWLW